MKSVEKFKFDFKHDFPEKLIDEEGFNLLYVTGKGEKETENKRFLRENCAQLRRGNFFDLYFIPKLTSELSKFYYQEMSNSSELNDTFDISILPCIFCDGDIMKNHNLLTLGCGNVNFVTKEIFKRYWNNSKILPIHFVDVADHTQIISEITGETYSESKSHGILEVVPNPINPSKIAIICAGTDILGTQAAVLALIKREDANKQSLSNNNSKPAKVVRAFTDKITLMGKYEIEVVNKFKFLE